MQKNTDVTLLDTTDKNHVFFFLVQQWLACHFCRTSLMFYSLCCGLFCFEMPIHAVQTQEEYQELDAIALRVGADKGSYYHNYTEIYSQYFATLKDKPIKFLEIGIYEGASVRLWEEYFKCADLHFMDITLERCKYMSERSHYHLCDQASPEQLQNFIQETGGDFDVILDDGGHMMNQQITSFITLFPYLKSGGMYIIEDLHTSYWSTFGGGGMHTTVNFLKKLIDEMNYVGATTTRASHLPASLATRCHLNIYQEKIASMHFYDSVVIIMKR